MLAERTQYYHQQTFGIRIELLSRLRTREEKYMEMGKSHQQNTQTQMQKTMRREMLHLGFPV